MPAYTENDILGALDDAQASETWPDFKHLDYDYLAARLTAYRDEERWAIVFSLIQWVPQEGISIAVEPIGNCVATPGQANAEQAREDYVRERLESLENMKQKFSKKPEGQAMLALMGLLPGQSAAKQAAFEQRLRENSQLQSEFEAKHLSIVKFVYKDEEPQEEDGSNVARVSIRGKLVDLSKLNIEPHFDLQGEGAFWVAVAVLNQYREEMLPQDEELAKFFADGMPPKFLVLDEWHHSQHGLASTWEVFRLLAKAMVEGDASLYQPMKSPNTHWRNWIAK